MARVRRLWLEDFRNFESIDVPLSPGTTVVTGSNGQGKSNLIEAIGWLASLSSFRGASTEVMVRAGAPQAVIRAEVLRDDRELLVEAELVPGKQLRVQVNRQRLSRNKDVLGLLPATVFSPGDLELIKGGPGHRRLYLDDVLVQCHPRNVSMRAELDRVLKQRNALLRQSRGRLDAAAETTLAVWDDKLIAAGEAWGRARAALVVDLGPRLAKAYASLAGGGALTVEYDAPWRTDGLAAALAARREEELRRGVGVVGPTRDELVVTLDGLSARTHASQGEQRSAALALRMAGHEVTAAAHDTSPVLLLDDVFSELDDARATALLGHLEAEQTIITSVGRFPVAGADVATLVVDGGRVSALPSETR